VTAADLIALLSRTIAAVERDESEIIRYCHCGEAMDAHGLGSGHSPVELVEPETENKRALLWAAKAALEQLNSTVPVDNEEQAQITASWRTVGTKAQLHADDNSDMIGAYWQRADGDWSAGTPQGVTVHGKREDAVAVVEKWAKNCGFLVRQ
jgi:hypothetical protein